MACAFPEIDLEVDSEDCSACLEQCQDLHQLFCLHRYCSECVENLTELNQNGTFECPLCKNGCSVHNETVSVLGNDPKVKENDAIAKHISFKSGQVRTCIGCSKMLAVTAYCFKCGDFLCDQCYHFHIENKTLFDHREHIINMTFVEEESARPVKLALNSKKPKCHYHARNMADICCITCGNVAICKTCIRGEHNEHDKEDVKQLAQSERDKLKVKISELETYKEILYNLPKRVEEVRQRLLENDSKATARLKEQHEQQSDLLQEQIRDNAEREKRGLEEMEKRRDKANIEIQQKLEEELQQVREVYDKILEEKDKEYDEIKRQAEEKYDEEDEKLLEELMNLENEAHGKRKTNN